MGYLQEFKSVVSTHNYPGLLKLWEEYCGSDMVDGLELRDILNIVQESDLAKSFGSYVELALPLWRTIEDEALSYGVLKLILDLQTSNSVELAEITFKTLKEKFGEHKYFGEKIRLIGLRSRESFQGALTNYELLTHLNKGKFVYHTGGWGTGEILDLSLVREQLVCEFENVIGRKDLSFQNAFKYLAPLPNDHFLARRFGDPDALEAQARKDPLAVIHLLLRNLGAKTAAEIKDELCELVIPEQDWTKWWQACRAKLKKDTKVETPSSVKEPFFLRETELSHDERFKQELELQDTLDGTILTIYNFMRDFSEVFKNEELKAFLRQRLDDALESMEPNPAQQLQIFVLKENLHEGEGAHQAAQQLKATEDLSEIINNIDIIAFKKRALLLLREHREDWPEIFLHLLFTTPQAPLKDYLLKELLQDTTVEMVLDKLREMREHPEQSPETMVWYFQKVMAGEGTPFSDQVEQGKFLEGFLVLLSRIENDNQYRDLTKKMLNILTAKRYELIRKALEESTIEFAKEFLLLATKCSSLSDHDIKILHSLAQVVHPSLATANKAQEEEEPIWTTEEGYTQTASHLKILSTEEVVKNAQEIEAARALGDLRENSEYKYALERRSQIQAEIKRLSDALNRARILTPEDISTKEAGVGTIVDLEKGSGDIQSYTLLGPWEADPDQNILSFQSQFAKAMTGVKLGEAFEFQGETYTVRGVKSFL